MNWITRLFSRDNGHYMSLRALAEETQVDHGTLRKAIFDGRLEAKKSGYVWLSTVEAVEQAIKEKNLRRP